ncbi:protein kinase domain-containing protein [Paucisalibacillus globulus]|uniref:protein kinase domain-containing protein n=1 Tax=Paucisalibacillus globulus TaxID=351095 RepID=UPI0003FB8E4C|nr:serine/threonine protein kinase [Paucisalibacillus globulus]
MIKKSINGVTFVLKEEHDFSWLEKIGKIFSVFDQQDSGNISFGIEIKGERRFIKYAGAKTVNSALSPEKAIRNLKKSVPLYIDLKHKNLVNLLGYFETDNGFTLLFDWFDGETLHNHWVFPPPYKYEHPDSPYYKFKQLPLEYRLDSLKKIFEFHTHVEKNDYIAIDFYDGSILYDFQNNQTRICDIDLYHKKPYKNKMGRMWGSSRFMSPEEFDLHAEIDGRTNVFNMGAIAFSLLGGELDRSYEKWGATIALYKVARRAVEIDRGKRYSSVQEFYDEWKSAMEQG